MRDHHSGREYLHDDDNDAYEKTMSNDFEYDDEEFEAESDDHGFEGDDMDIDDDDLELGDLKFIIYSIDKQRVNLIEVAGINCKRYLNVGACCTLVEIIIEKKYLG